MADDVRTLFDDYAVRYRRGDRPDLREYLRRAGKGADELARLVEGWLEHVEPPAPDEDDIALARSWVAGASPLLELRTRRGLRRAEVVDALIGALGLDPDKREKVRRYYHQLESGLLEPARVDRRVWEALGENLRARAADLFAWRLPPARLQEHVAYFRVEADALVDAQAAAPPAATPEEPDEIDRLFGAADRD